MSENWLLRLFLSLEHLIFEFVSNFDIRISNSVNRIWLNHALWETQSQTLSSLWIPMNSDHCNVIKLGRVIDMIKKMGFDLL